MQPRSMAPKLHGYHYLGIFSLSLSLSLYGVYIKVRDVLQSIIIALWLYKYIPWLIYTKGYYQG